MLETDKEEAIVTVLCGCVGLRKILHTELQDLARGRS